MPLAHPFEPAEGVRADRFLQTGCFFVGLLRAAGHDLEGERVFQIIIQVSLSPRTPPADEPGLETGALPPHPETLAAERGLAIEALGRAVRGAFLIAELALAARDRRLGARWLGRAIRLLRCAGQIAMGRSGLEAAIAALRSCLPAPPRGEDPFT